MAWLYKQKGGDNWWIGWRSNGRQFLKSTKTSDRKEAEKKLREQETLAQMHSDGRLSEIFVEAVTGQQKPKITFKKAIEEWLTGSEIEQVFVEALYEGFDQDKEPTD